MTDIKLARNVTRLAHLELPGAGQVYVERGYAYIGHLANKERLGTTILDVSDPRRPRIVAQIFLDDPNSHSHKVRVVGDIMIVNSEQNGSALGRKSEQLASARAALEQSLGRAPTHAELAARLSVREADVPALEAAERSPYDQGGFRIYDVRDRARPRLIAFQKTGGKGVHRYDMDERYAYNYHPPFPEPTHTFREMPERIGGRRIAVAIDEEDQAHSAEEMARRRGRPHAALWVFDATDLANLRPLSVFQASELDSPWSRAAPGRFGAHQFFERMKAGTLVYCAWFAGGLRIVDLADLAAPAEVGYFIPEPAQGRAGPLTNDVDVDERGVIYLVDRGPRFDILEFNPRG